MAVASNRKTEALDSVIFSCWWFLVTINTLNWGNPKKEDLNIGIASFIVFFSDMAHASLGTLINP